MLIWPDFTERQISAQSSRPEEQELRCFQFRRWLPCFMAHHLNYQINRRSFRPFLQFGLQPLNYFFLDMFRCSFGSPLSIDAYFDGPPFLAGWR